MKISGADDRPPQRRRQWRFYRTAGGNEPVLDFLTDKHLPDEDAAAIAAGMTEVRHMGREHRDVNHLRGDIWQIEIDARSATYRLLFAEEGRYHQVLLALEMVNKKWQKAKGRHINLAEQRLADWRERGARQKLARSASGPSPR
ncbi:MAG: type II toxin-antitoxin system RelE/ParE family toxin [Candidatus Dormibacteria bacterium]